MRAYQTFQMQPALARRKVEQAKQAIADIEAKIEALDAVVISDKDKRTQAILGWPARPA